MMAGENHAKIRRSWPRAILRLMMVILTFAAITPLVGGVAFGLLFAAVGMSLNGPLMEFIQELMRFVSKMVSVAYEFGWKQALVAGLVFGLADMFGRAGWLLAILVGGVAGTLIIALDKLSQPNGFIALFTVAGIFGALASYWLIRRASRALA